MSDCGYWLLCLLPALPANRRKTQADINSVASQKYCAFQPVQTSSRIQEKQQQYRRTEHDPLVELQDSRVHGKRLQQSGYTQDSQQIKDVAAQYVADGHICMPTQRRDHRNR